jgi:hypothetical protein
MQPEPGGAEAHRKGVARLPIATLYFAVIALPPGLFYFGLSSSQTLGFMLVSLLLLNRRFAGTRRRIRLTPAARIKLGGFAVVVLPVVTLHFFVAAALQSVYVVRAVGSLLPLTLLLVAGAAFARTLVRVPGPLLQRGLTRCFVVMCGVALLGAAGLAVPTLLEDWRRPVFPFSEPSTFALAFIPLLLFVVVSARGPARAGYLLLGLACTILIQNLTLAVGFLLVASLTLRISILVALAAILAVGGAQLDLSYYTDRLDFSGEVSNLSNLVYLQGWQMIEEAWHRSSGVGLGFQQLGIQGTDVPAAHVLRSLRDGEDMNLLDGGFVFAKLGSDFGLLGGLLALAYLMLAARSLLALRAAAGKPGSVAPVLILMHCTILSFSIELFVRGAGYFTGAALLLVAALNVLALRRRHHSLPRSSATIAVSPTTA